jgi:2-phosphosulfolactate phosphatase
MFCDQSAFDIRCEWGERGLAALLGGSDAVILIDVLSFSTTVDVAVSRGAIIYPFRNGDPSVASFAAEKRAEIVARRGTGRYSFSPRAMLDVPPGARLVLPSQNGSALSLMTGGVPTLTGCLRNRRAVAEYARNMGRKIAVIPCGERWDDDSLRPALEDWLAAGAIIDALPQNRSPEAWAAVAAFHVMRENLAAHLRQTPSYRELEEIGEQDDANFATHLDCSECIPILMSGAYANAATNDREVRCPPI